MSWLRLGLARLRDERTATVAFALLVFVTSFLVAVSPRLYERSQEGALESELAAARSSERNIELSKETRIAPAISDPIAAIEQAGRQEEAKLPQDVRALVSESTFVVESPRWLPTEPILWTTVIARIQQGAPERVEYIHGTAPTDAVDHAQDGMPVLEASLSESAATQLGVTPEELGFVMELQRDTTDPHSVNSIPIGLRFTGIFRSDTPRADAYWFDDDSIFRPRIRRVSVENSFTDVVVLLAPAAYPALFTETSDPPARMRFAWRYLLDPTRITAERLDQLTADVRRMEGLFRDRFVGPGTDTETALRSQLLSLLETHLLRWRSASLVLATAAVAPVTLAAICIGSFAFLSAARRSRLLTTSRARGASAAQVLLATLGEGIVISVPASVAAAALALWLVRGPRAEPTIVAAAAVGAGSLCLVLATVAVRFASVLRAQPGEEALRRARYRRLVFEGFVLALAAVAALLLSQRGIAASGSSRPIGSADLLLTATPALVGVAAGIIAARLFPALVSSLGRLTVKRRDLIPALALRRASRQDRAGPVLVVLVAAAVIATFAAGMIAYLERSATDIAWHETAAPFRIRVPSGSLPADFSVADVDGVESQIDAVRGRATGVQRTFVEFLAVDPQAFKDIVAGTPADVELSGALLDQTGGALPAIVSTSLSREEENIVPSETFRLSLAGESLNFVAVATRDTFPTLPVDRPFVVVPP